MLNIVQISLFVFSVLVPVARAEIAAIVSTEKESNLNIGVGYSLMADLAEEEKPREYTHSFSAKGRYKFINDYAVFAGGSVEYSTIGNKIYVEEADNPYSFTFLTGASKRFELGKAIDGDHDILFTIANSFPVSDDARYEGYKSIPALSGMLSSTFFDGAWSIGNNISYSYIINAFDKSQTTGKVNPKDSLTYTLSNSVKIWRGFSAGVDFGVKFQRRLDNSVDYEYRNIESIMYSFGKMALLLTYENGGYTDNGDVSLWFIDKYRRLFSGAISFAF